MATVRFTFIYDWPKFDITKIKAMKTLGFLLLVFLSVSGFRNIPFGIEPVTTDEKSGFKLVRSDNNILIYSRWIAVDENRSTRQLKAEFDINCQAENILRVLSDEKSYTSWMNSTKSYYRLETISQSEWLVYVQFSIPWPLNNQDCILKYETHISTDQSTIEIFLSSQSDYLKPIEGVERISDMQAKWVFTKLSIEKTHVEYYVSSNQAPKYPIWLTDPLIQKNLINTMNSLREVIINKKI